MGRYKPVILGIVVVLVLAGCAPQAGAPSATALPLATSAQPVTPTAMPAVSATTAPIATETPPATAEATPVASGQAAPAVIVEMKNFAFVPGDITISAGTTVTWRNSDDAPHTATADDKSFDSGDMGAGDEFSYTFTGPGEYPYYCVWHGAAGGQGMAGKVTVK